MSGTEAWQPSAPLEHLRLRARIMAGIRAFFAARGVLEVETPILSAAATTDPNLESFSTVYRGPGAAEPKRYYLHTSPEFPMKRLLAAGSGPIYQICKVFRQGELGGRHNPEFTMLEWYRPGLDHLQLMDEVEALLGEVLGDRLGPAERLSHANAFRRYAGVDPNRSSLEELSRAAELHGVDAEFGGTPDRELWLDLLMSHVVEPNLGRGRATFIYNYPASQAALARLGVDGEGTAVAERFEVYVDGVELANGFHELGDAREQRHRFERDVAVRALRRAPKVPMDERLLSALAHGLPDSAGVALGIDRLVMLAAGAAHIQQVVAFPFERA